MARSTKASESPAPDFQDDLYDASPPPSGQGRHSNAQQPSLSPSPATSVSSDKENRSSRVVIDKGKGRAPMGPPRVPSPSAARRRKRAAELEAQGDRTRRRRTVEVEDASDEEYDPDQDVEARRKMRQEYRDLNQDLKENETDYLEPENTGLRDILMKANNLSKDVKQTADATIDARLLAQAADLASKRTNILIAGDHSLAIDLDDFVNRVKAFMRGGDGRDDTHTATQRRRREEDEENDGEILNWEYLGRECIKHVARPAIPGFLLGPLSVEKRAKKAIVRKVALRPNSIKETRPEVLQAGDIEKDENKNLTTLCTQILGRLRKVRGDAIKAVEAQASEDMSQKEVDELMDAYGVSPDGGIALFKFVINPFHFGQTIENMFYVSFLIRDGKIGISIDLRGLPYLDIHDKEDGEDSSKKNNNPAKHQAVLSMDHKTWKDLIDAFDIKEPMIKHRVEEEQSQMGAKGWYA